MKMMFAIIAMLLTTASARTLKEYKSCTEDYQPPNYWGRCIDGMYQIDEVWQGGYDIYCNCLIILVPEDIVGIGVSMFISTSDVLAEALVLLCLFLTPAFLEVDVEGTTASGAKAAAVSAM